jgi:uncharacterized membrane protein
MMQVIMFIAGCVVGTLIADRLYDEYKKRK